MTRSSALQMIHRNASSHQKKKTCLAQYGCLLLACLTLPRRCDSLLSSFRQHRPIRFPVCLPSKVQSREIGYITTTRIQELFLRVTFVEPDYLITDSIDIDTRPTLLRVLSRPSVVLRMLLLLVGVGISISNIIGEYNDLYMSLEAIAIAMGMLTALADYKASIPPYGSPTDTVSPNVRSGVVDDAVVHLYAATYTASATWLVLRSSLLCPSWLFLLDPLLGMAAGAIFLFSFFAPVLTLLHHYKYVNVEPLLQAMVSVARQGKGMNKEPLPDLTGTEVLRAQSLFGVGVVGCLFAPISVKFAISGQDWWFRVSEIYPEQGILESSTALFGILATQASMVAHTSAKAGVAPFRTVAPAFVVVCIVLTIFPCACALHFLKDVSYFSHYAL